MEFAERRVDVAVLEVGMGGRFDATNVVRPLVSVITTIAKDHETHLGARLGKIAFEKAGIIKPGVPVVCGVRGGAALSEMRRVTRERGALLTEGFGPGRTLEAPRAVNIASITDGTSNTILIGEKSLPQRACTWVGDNGNANANSVTGSIRPAINESFNNGFGSYHPGGAMFGLADGSVRFISETIASNNAGVSGTIGPTWQSAFNAAKAGMRTYQFLGVRDDSMVGTKAKDSTVNPGTFDFKNGGASVSGPLMPNKLFFFGSMEGEKFLQPGTTLEEALGT